MGGQRGHTYYLFQYFTRKGKGGVYLYDFRKKIGFEFFRKFYWERRGELPNIFTRFYWKYSPRFPPNAKTQDRPCLVSYFYLTNRFLSPHGEGTTGRINPSKGR